MGGKATTRGVDTTGDSMGVKAGKRGGTADGLGQGPLKSHDTTTGWWEPGNFLEFSSHVGDNDELRQWVDNGNMVGSSPIINH